MFRINHNDAIELEDIVRGLYKCDRCGVSGLADADNFGSNPICAAYLVVAYVHAKGLQTSGTQYADFLYRYETIFNEPDENNAKNEVQSYINELSHIADLYK